MEIMKGIHQVDGVNGNCYLVQRESGWVLIDTGMPGNADKIVKYLSSINLKPSDITLIAITHCHIDHVGSLARLKQLSGAKVACHEDDADFISGKRQLQMPKGVPFYFRILLPLFKAKPVEPDILLKDGQMIGGFEVVHTPGHTPGSICLLDRNTKSLFVGDNLRFMDGQIKGPPIVMDAAPMKKSIARIAELEFETMYSGHGKPLTPGASKKIKDVLPSLIKSVETDNIQKNVRKDKRD